MVSWYHIATVYSQINGCGFGSLEP